MSENSSFQKLFLVDALALIYRAHFVFIKNPRINTKGLNTSATMGFTNSLVEILQKEQPTHIIVAFDTPEPTFRHKTYEAYKASRDVQPEDITIAIPYAKKIAKALGIHVIEAPGYEADDIIGTLVQKALNKGFDKIYMMTPDKDFSQLVNENTYLYKPASRGNGVQILGIKEVLEGWNIKKIDQVRDILGLQGDAVDNIPGIPMVGPKTAQKLIEKYDSIENLLKHTDELKGRLRENIETFGSQGLLSKELATIHTDIPLKFKWEDSVYKGIKKEDIQTLFHELEFQTLAHRLLGTKNINKQVNLFEVDECSALEKKNYDSITKPNVLSTVDELQEVINNLLQKDMISLWFLFDKNSLNQYIVEAISFASESKKAYVIPIKGKNDNEFLAKVIQGLKPILESKKIKKIGYDLKKIYLTCRAFNVVCKGLAFDTMIAHSLIEPEGRHTPETIARSYLNHNWAKLLYSDELINNMAAHSDMLFQVRKPLLDMLESMKLMDLFLNIEMPLLNVLSEMEWSGVKLDVGFLKKMSEKVAKDLFYLEKDIHNEAGIDFNIASPKQLGEVLFDRLKLLDNAKKTSKSGQYATNESVLNELAGKHKIVATILVYRELSKLKSTYIDALPALVSPRDARIHTSYQQAIVSTGRLSSVNPNLQNIPIRTERGKAIRKAFVPGSKDGLILSADYSQIELRIMASFSGDKHMIEAFKSGEDIHTETASKVFRVPKPDVTALMRRQAKMVNFGLIYGISAFGLGQRLGVSRKEASSIMEVYFSEFPMVQSYMQHKIEEAKRTGYASTLLGRRRPLRDINSRNSTLRGFAERNAINMPIQGTAAELIKLAMVSIDQWLKKENLHSKMVMQIHDELVFDVTEKEALLLKKEIPKIMCSAIKFDVPLAVNVGLGKNWLEAHG